MPDKAVEHAKSYPFFIPETSYVLGQQGWQAIAPSAPPMNRHAVIASGSNASPDRLVKKFKPCAELLGTPIQITRATLHDFATVYSAHFTNYGSIPATLAYVPGTVSDVFVTWLTDDQLERMHETESVGVNYHYAQLSGLYLKHETGEIHTTAQAYLSTRGCLNKDNAPIALADMNQADVLSYAKSKVAPEQADTDAFILSNINCADTRARHTQKLEDKALPLGWDLVKILR